MPEESPRRRGRTARVSREKILEASLAEFARHGYEGATTASVARRIGVTQPLIHYHFGSKEALWRAAVELAFSRVDAVLEGIDQDGDPGPAVRLREVTHRFVRFASEHPDISRLILAESAVAGPRLEWMAQKHLKPLVERVGAVFGHGRDLGLVKDLSLQSLIFIYLGAVPHFFDAAPLVGLLWGVDPTAPDSVRIYAETLTEVLCSGILAPPRS